MPVDHPSSPAHPLSRRSFLKASALYGAFAILPSGHLRGQGAPSKTVNLAAIGIGNQGLSDLKALTANGLCQVVALCDVDLQGPHTAEAQALHPNARRFTDFRQLFDAMANDIDAVLVATPDHSHFSIAMLAMSLGKHVYVEKPLGHTFGQCERLIDLARRSGVVTQMGNQGHSGAQYFQFQAFLEAGLFQDVTRITAHMNNERRWHGWGATVERYPTDPLPDGIDWDLWMDYAPEHPFSAKLHPQEWRSWFDYGSGAFGDWGPHILDTAHRFLQLGLPTKIAALRREGPNPLVFPQASTIAFSFPARPGMPACEVTWYDGTANLPPVEPELGPLVADPDTGHAQRQPVAIERPGKIIYAKDHVFQGASHSEILQVLPLEKHMDLRRSLPRFPQKNSNHYDNFLLACLGQEEARSPFHISGPLTQVFNLGMIAQRLGGQLDFDPATKTIPNNPLAQALLDPAPRPQFAQYYKL